MEFRFREITNLGGSFRINFTKTGISYSHGIKSFRDIIRENKKNIYYHWNRPFFDE